MVVRFEHLEVIVAVTHHHPRWEDLRVEVLAIALEGCDSLPPATIERAELDVLGIQGMPIPIDEGILFRGTRVEEQSS